MVYSIQHSATARYLALHASEKVKSKKQYFIISGVVHAFAFFCLGH